jgi:hypothetical protein
VSLDPPPNKVSELYPEDLPMFIPFPEYLAQQLRLFPSPEPDISIPDPETFNPRYPELELAEKSGFLKTKPPLPK